MSTPKPTPPKSSTPKPTTSTPTAPTETQVTLSATAIADVGADLTRLVVAAIPLSLRAVNTVAANLPGMITRVTASLEGAASAQSSSELGAATSELVSATAGFSLNILKLAASGLNAVARAVNTAVTESSTPPPK